MTFIHLLLAKPSFIDEPLRQGNRPELPTLKAISRKYVVSEDGEYLTQEIESGTVIETAVEK
jgi:hypothetical protein